MKNFKRLLCLILVAIMLIPSWTPVHAEDERFTSTTSLTGDYKGMTKYRYYDDIISFIDCDFNTFGEHENDSVEFNNNSFKYSCDKGKIWPEFWINLVPGTELECTISTGTESKVFKVNENTNEKFKLNGVPYTIYCGSTYKGIKIISIKIDLSDDEASNIMYDKNLDLEVKYTVKDTQQVINYAKDRYKRSFEDYVYDQQQQEKIDSISKRVDNANTLDEIYAANEELVNFQKAYKKQIDDKIKPVIDRVYYGKILKKNSDSAYVLDDNLVRALTDELNFSGSINYYKYKNNNKVISWDEQLKNLTNIEPKVDVELKKAELKKKLDTIVGDKDVFTSEEKEAYIKRIEEIKVTAKLPDGNDIKTQATEALSKLAEIEREIDAKIKAKELLKEAKDAAKTEIGNLPNLSDTEKDTYKGKVDQATDKAGVTTALNEAKAQDQKNKDKKDLEKAKEDATKQIEDLKNLTPAEKEKYKKDVQDATTREAINEAVAEAKAKDAENLKTAKDEATKEIEDLKNLTPAEKDKYKKAVEDATDKDGVTTALDEAKAQDQKNKDQKDLDKAKEEAKTEIGNLPNLSDTEKDTYKGKVDQATDKAGVTTALDEAKTKDKENKELKEAKDAAKTEIGNLPNLSDTEKDEYKGKVDEATDKDGVTTALDEAKAKDKENKELKEAKDAAKTEIGNLPNLSEDEKKEAKDKVDKAQTKEEVKKAVDEAKAKDAEKGKTPTEEEKKEAKDIIDKLPNLSEDEKKEAKDKVDKAQIKEEVKNAVDEAKAKDAEIGKVPTPVPTPVPQIDFNRSYFAQSYQKPTEVKKTSKYTVETIIKIGSNKITRVVNGVPAEEIEMDVAAFIDNDRTYLPLRFVGESMGFKVTWDEANRVAILKNKDKEVKIAVDSNVFYVNGERFESDVKPMIKNSRTMIPVGNFARAIGLQDGKDIFWDGVSREVKIKQVMEY